MYSFRFRPALVPGLAAAALIAATVSLGNWQARRAQEKQDLARRLDDAARSPVLAVPAGPVSPRELEHRRVTASGRFVPAQTIYLDNKVHEGVAGYHVVSPLRIDGSELHVLVNRGWIAAGDRRTLPVVPTPATAVRIDGIASVPSGRFLELAPDTARGPLRQNLVIEREAERSGLRLQPVVVLQTSSADDGLVRAWPRPDAGADRHRGYALQWYSLAALALALFLFFSVRRTRAGEA